MKKDLLEKLGKYGLSAGAVVGAGATAQGQITYTDLNPDVTVTANGFYQLDLNNDMTIDFTINANGYSYTYGSYSSGSNLIYASGNANNGIMMDSSFYAYALSSGSAINNAASWSNNGSLVGSFFFASSTFSFSTSYGAWTGGVTDKYLGLRVEISGSYYYGWARLDVPGPDEFTIKDYAIQTNAGLSIDAGQDFALPPAPADVAMNVVGTDVDNNANGLDLQVAFDMAMDETTVSAYRIMVVKAANAGTFDLAAAQTVPSINYETVTPTGANISTVLNASSRDVDGNFIIENQPYRIFIMSVADGTNAQFNALSNMSNEVTLTTPALPSDPALNPVAADIDDNANGSDLEVTWDAAADESKVVIYRAIAVKSANAASFTVNDAQSTPLASGKTLLPNGSANYTMVLNSTQNDADGDPIVEGVPYRIIIQSVADGTNANADTISMPSNEVTLNPIVTAEAPQNVMLADVDDNVNGSDVEVTFDQVMDESTISEYRVFVIKSNDAAAFDLTTAMANNEFTTVTPMNQNITLVLDATFRDTDGDLITKDEPYRARVVSVADGTNAQLNSISNISNEITLDDPLSVDSPEDVNMSVFFTGETIRITSGDRLTAVEVFDLTGASVISVQANANRLDITTAELSSGIYMVHATSEEAQSVQKVIIP